MAAGLDRRRFLAMLGALGTAAVLPAGVRAASGSAADEAAAALLRRISGVTIGVPDPEALRALYVDVFGYEVTARGRVAQALAQSWGAPASAGRRFISMRPASGADVFIRAVEIDEVPGYRPLSTTGWNVLELIVDDVYGLHEELKKGPFEILGTPHSLGGNLASIHAMQMVGPAQEVVYLTAETGDRSRSSLPIPKSPVDRPFIMVLAGNWLPAMEHHYSERLGLASGGQWTMPIRPIARANGLPEDTLFDIALLRCAEAGHGIELDSYPATAGPRPRPAGQLPPGIAITSFAVDRVAGLGATLPFFQPPAELYGKRQAATFIGPVGELIELIDAG